MYVQFLLITLYIYNLVFCNNNTISNNKNNQLRHLQDSESSLRSTNNSGEDYIYKEINPYESTSTSVINDNSENKNSIIYKTFNASVKYISPVYYKNNGYINIYDFYDNQVKDIQVELKLLTNDYEDLKHFSYQNYGLFCLVESENDLYNKCFNLIRNIKNYFIEEHNSLFYKELTNDVEPSFSLFKDYLNTDYHKSDNITNTNSTNNDEYDIYNTNAYKEIQYENSKLEKIFLTLYLQKKYSNVILLLSDARFLPLAYDLKQSNEDFHYTAAIFDESSVDSNTKRLPIVFNPPSFAIAQKDFTKISFYDLKTILSLLKYKKLNNKYDIYPNIFYSDIRFNSVTLDSALLISTLFSLINLSLAVVSFVIWGFIVNKHSQNRNSNIEINQVHKLLMVLIFMRQAICFLAVKYNALSYTKYNQETAFSEVYLSTLSDIITALEKTIFLFFSVLLVSGWKITNAQMFNRRKKYLLVVLYLFIYICVCSDDLIKMSIQSDSYLDKYYSINSNNDNASSNSIDDNKSNSYGNINDQNRSFLSSLIHLIVENYYKDDLVLTLLIPIKQIILSIVLFITIRKRSQKAISKLESYRQSAIYIAHEYLPSINLKLKLLKNSKIIFYLSQFFMIVMAFINPLGINSDYFSLNSSHVYNLLLLILEVMMMIVFRPRIYPEYFYSDMEGLKNIKKQKIYYCNLLKNYNNKNLASKNSKKHKNTMILNKKIPIVIINPKSSFIEDINKLEESRTKSISNSDIKIRDNVNNLSNEYCSINTQVDDISELNNSKILETEGNENMSQSKLSLNSYSSIINDSYSKESIELSNITSEADSDLHSESNEEERNKSKLEVIKNKKNDLLLEISLGRILY